MRYMLMLHADEKGGEELSSEDMVLFMGQMFAYQKALEKAGAFVATDALVGASEAAVVRARGDTIEVQDGPYSDAREQFGGYFIIDVTDLNEAKKWASNCPAATWGTVEIRRIRVKSDLGT